MLWAVVQSFAESATQGSGWQERLEGIKDLLEGDDLLVLLADGLEHHCVRPLAQLLHHVVLAEHVLYGAVSGRSSVRRALQSEGALGVRRGACAAARGVHATAKTPTLSTASTEVILASPVRASVPQARLSRARRFLATPEGEFFGLFGASFLDQHFHLDYLYLIIKVTYQHNFG